MNKLLYAGAIILLLGSSCTAFAEVTAFNHSVTLAFNRELSDTVDKILNDSVIKNWTSSLALFLAFVGLTWATYVYVRLGEVLLFVQIIILFVIFWAIYGVYGRAVTEILDLLIALGDSIYKAAMGMVKADTVIDTARKAVTLPSADLFSDMSIVWAVILWEAALSLLTVAVYFADIFTIVGASTAKVVGILFLPFIIVPWTQPMFGRWFNFLALWGVSSIFLKITSIIVLVVVRASINYLATDGSFKTKIGTIIDSDFHVDKIMSITEDTITVGITAGAFILVCVILVFSSFALAKQCVGNMNIGGTINRGAVKVAATAVKTIF